MVLLHVVCLEGRRGGIGGKKVTRFSACLHVVRSTVGDAARIRGTRIFLLMKMQPEAGRARSVIAIVIITRLTLQVQGILYVVVQKGHVWIWMRTCSKRYRVPSHVILLVEVDCFACPPPRGVVVKSLPDLWDVSF